MAVTWLFSKSQTCRRTSYQASDDLTIQWPVTCDWLDGTQSRRNRTDNGLEIKLKAFMPLVSFYYKCLGLGHVHSDSVYLERKTKKSAHGLFRRSGYVCVRMCVYEGDA